MLCSVNEVAAKLQAIVNDINANIEKLDTRGPVSKYVVPEIGLRGRFVTISIFMLLLSHLPEANMSHSLLLDVR